MNPHLSDFLQVRTSKEISGLGVLCKTTSTKEVRPTIQVQTLCWLVSYALVLAVYLGLPLCASASKLKRKCREKLLEIVKLKKEIKSIDSAPLYKWAHFHALLRPLFLSGVQQSRRAKLSARHDTRWVHLHRAHIRNSRALILSRSDIYSVRLLWNL